MKIYLATWLEDNQGESLTERGACRRLVSYWFVKDLPEEDFRRYAETGRLVLGREDGNGSNPDF